MLRVSGLGDVVQVDANGNPVPQTLGDRFAKLAIDHPWLTSASMGAASGALWHLWGGHSVYQSVGFALVSASLWRFGFWQIDASIARSFGQPAPPLSAPLPVHPALPGVARRPIPRLPLRPAPRPVVAPPRAVPSSAPRAAALPARVAIAPASRPAITAPAAPAPVLRPLTPARLLLPPAGGFSASASGGYAPGSSYDPASDSGSGVTYNAPADATASASTPDTVAVAGDSAPAPAPRKPIWPWVAVALLVAGVI